MLEERRLLAILVVDVVSGVMGVRSSASGYVHVPFTGSSPTVDGTNADDTIYVVETDGRFLTVDPKSGVDSIIFGDSPNDGTDHDNDLDQLSDAGVRVLAGSDASDNLVEIRDDQDATSNGYTITETSFGRMRLVKNDLPANESEWVEWETANVDAVVRTSAGNGTVDIGTSVQMNSTDESLTIDDSFGDGGSTVNVDGGWASPAAMPSVLGGSGSDQLNYTHLPAIWNSDDLFFNGDSGTDGLYIDMAGTRADLKHSEIEVFATAGSALIDYFSVENLVVDNQTTVNATYNLISSGGTLAWANTTIMGSSGSDSVVVGATGGKAFECNVDLDLQLSSGLDSLSFSDLLETTGRAYDIQNDLVTFGSGTVRWVTALEQITVNAGGGNDTITVGDGIDVLDVDLNGGVGDDAFTIRALASADLAITGGSPTTSPGDTLTLTQGGESSGRLSIAAPGAGTYSFDNREPIVFSGIETYTLPPAAAPAPDLDAASDSGQSNGDNITQIQNATFTGTVGAANVPVRLFDGSTLIGSGTSNASGAYSIAASFPGGTATYAVTVTYEPASAPLMSAPSAALGVTVDTIAPAAPVAPPDLRIASDTGVSDTDNVTNDATPSFNVTTSELTRFQAAGATVLDYAAGAIVTLPAQAGATYSYTVRSVDVAGNESAASGALLVTIDTTPPVVGGSAPDLLAGNDTGESSSDNITSDPQPSFSVAGAGGATYARLFRGATQISDNWQLASGVQAIDMLEGANVITAVLFDTAGNQSTTSTPPATVTLDTVRPQLVGSPAFLFEREFTQPHALTYFFSEDVQWSIAAADFAVTNTTTNQSPASTVAYNAALNRGLVRFPASIGGGNAAGALEDGNYVSQVAANNVRDVAGNPLNASSTLNFHVLAGDANRDRRVNFDDLLILASNYNASGRTFAQANFSYDAGGTVNFDDLLILAANYNKTIAAGSPAPVVSPGGDDASDGDSIGDDVLL